VQLSHDLLVGPPRRKQQNQPRPSAIFGTATSRPRTSLQLLTLRRCNEHTSISLAPQCERKPLPVLLRHATSFAVMRLYSAACAALEN